MDFGCTFIWSFIVAVFTPMIVILFFKNKKHKFIYADIKKIKDIKE